MQEELLEDVDEFSIIQWLMKILHIPRGVNNKKQPKEEHQSVDEKDSILEFRRIYCPSCGQKMRLPFDKLTANIICPTCEFRFNYLKSINQDVEEFATSMDKKPEESVEKKKSKIKRKSLMPTIKKKVVLFIMVATIALALIRLLLPVYYIDRGKYTTQLKYRIINRIHTPNVLHFTVNPPDYYSISVFRTLSQSSIIIVIGLLFVILLSRRKELEALLSEKPPSSNHIDSKIIIQR